jgi:hypothetical protein
MPRCSLCDRSSDIDYKHLTVVWHEAEQAFICEDCNAEHYEIMHPKRDPQDAEEGEYPTLPSDWDELLLGPDEFLEVSPVVKAKAKDRGNSSS